MTNNDVVVISHLEFISDGIRYRIATVVGDADELLSNVPRAPDGIRLAIAKERNVLNSLQKNYDFIRFET